MTPSANVSRPSQMSPTAATANHAAPQRARAAVHAEHEPLEQRGGGEHRQRRQRRAGRAARRAAETAGCSRAARGRRTSARPRRRSPGVRTGRRGRPAPRDRGCADRRAATSPPAPRRAPARRKRAIVKTDRRPGSYRPGPRPTRHRRDGDVPVGTPGPLGSSSREQTLDNRHVEIMTSTPPGAPARPRTRRTRPCALRSGARARGSLRRRWSPAVAATGHPRAARRGHARRSRDVPLLPRLLGRAHASPATRSPRPTARRATSAASATASTTATACSAKASSAAAAACCRCRSRP